MRVISTLSPPTDTLGSLALYSGMDVLSLYEIQAGLAGLLDTTRLATYEFEMELQTALLEMSLNGVPVDEAARREMIVTFTQEQKDLTELLNSLLDAVGYFDYYIRLAQLEFSLYVPLSPELLPASWDEWLALPLSTRRELKAIAPNELAVFQKALKEFTAPFNPNSPAQKLRLFYHFFGSPANTTAAGYHLPPPWLKTHGISEYKSRNTKGEFTPAADREALEKIIKAADTTPAAFWAAPFAYICLALADLAKTLGFLNCRLEQGIFRASFGAVTETGRLSSRANAQGYGSNGQNITPKLRHILISPPGYKLAAPDYEQIESRNVGAICFSRLDCDAYLNASECGDLHTLVASMVWEKLGWPEDFTLTYLRKHGPFPSDMIRAAKKIAGAQFYRHFSYRDAVKRLGHGCLTADHEVLTPTGWVSITEKPPVILQRDGTFAEVSNWIDKPYTGDFIEWEGTAISVKMTADHRVYYTTDQRSTCVKPAARVPATANIELSHNYSGGGVAEPLAALYAAYHCDGEYSGYNQVRFNFHKERKILRLTALADSLSIPWHQHDNGTISLNWKPTFHAPGWFMFEWDRTSLAAYMNELVHWDGHTAGTSQSIFSVNREWIELWQTFNRLLGNGGNIQKPHISGFGSVVWKLQVNNRKYAYRKAFTRDKRTTETQQVYCPTVPAAAFYVRRKGKISITGNSNYTGKPGHMAQLTHIPKPLVEHFQEAYFEAFPEIPQWHRWVAEQVQTSGEIVTLFGRARRFFGRPNDDATIRKAVAYEPQSMAADYTNQALLRIHKAARDNPIVLFLQKHDEIGFRFPDAAEMQVIELVRGLMEQHITLTSPSGRTRDWYVPTDFESGWNLGRASSTNPDGLSKPDPNRTRLGVKSWKEWKL